MGSLLDKVEEGLSQGLIGDGPGYDGLALIFRSDVAHLGSSPALVSSAIVVEINQIQIFRDMGSRKGSLPF